MCHSSCILAIAIIKIEERAAGTIFSLYFTNKLKFGTIFQFCELILELKYRMIDWIKIGAHMTCTLNIPWIMWKQIKNICQTGLIRSIAQNCYIVSICLTICDLFGYN